MNFQDTSWIDDPAVVIGEISTGGNYALSVNGAFNALSLNQDGKDINDIFLKLNDFNPNSLCNLYVSNLITTGTINTSNIILSNTLNQIEPCNINLKGNLFTSGNINVGVIGDTNKNIFIGGSIQSTSNITANSNIITTNIISSNITNIGNVGIGTNATNNYKLNVDGSSSFSNFVNFSNSINQLNSISPNIILGNIGIGTTNAKGYKLNVEGSASFTNNVNFSNSINQLNSISHNIILGNVGIGTTNLENYKFNVNGISLFKDTSTFSNAIRQLNLICHELESLILSQRKLALDPHWVRPSQITTFVHAPRYELTNEHRLGFARNKYDRELGGVYMHWTQIGKTLYEVFRDESAPKLNVGSDATDISVGSGATCEAINALKFYSGEFDIEWSRDVVRGGTAPWHDAEQAKFQAWIESNGLNFDDPKLSLGYLKIGQVDLAGSFGTTDAGEIWKKLGQHLDIYSIEVNGVVSVFDYAWSDSDHYSRQLENLKRIEHGMA